MGLDLQTYIYGVHQSVATYNSQWLEQQLTINPPSETAAAIASFPDPSEVDLYLLPDKFKPLIRSYIKLMKSIHVHRAIDTAFENFLAFMSDFNRVAEVTSNWICLALINSSNELLSLHQVRSASKDKAENDASLEKVGVVINRLFKICLTDKSVEPATSKKSCIHFFLAALIKIYFKLDHLELARSMEKALLGTNSMIPTIQYCPVDYRKHVVTYLYYSSLLSLDDGEFSFAELKLQTALQFLSCYKKIPRVRPHIEKILMLLIPLTYFLKGMSPSNEIYDQYPHLKLVYKENILKAIKEGNVLSFEAAVQKLHKIFLNRHIYILIVKLKYLCYLLLFKKTALYYKLFTQENPHIIPFLYLQRALKMSKDDQEEVPVEEVECILANLIVQRRVKGYLSHTNKCIVLLKTEAFPKPSVAAT